MINLFIVSNTKHVELAHFLEQRGTFSVIGSYDSITNNSVQIQNDVLKVDKTLYLYQTEGATGEINIRSDMQHLQKMIETNGFFNPGEILFMTQNNELGNQAIRYFMSVMDSCKYTKYSVKTSENVISYMNVYDSLMGVSQDANFYNKYRVLYRREAEEESTAAYEPNLKANQIIEPFGFENLRDYSNQKELVNKATTAMKYTDEDVELQKMDKPVLPTIEVTNKLDGPKICVMTGKSKSGLSTWASVLAVSGNQGDTDVAVLDFTDDRGVKSTLENTGIGFTAVSMQDVLLEEPVLKEKLKVVTMKNKREKDVTIQFLQKIFDRKIQLANWIFVVVNTDEFEDVCRILDEKIYKVLYTTVPKYSDVLSIQEHLQILMGKRVMVILNDSVELNWEEKMSQEEVKKLLALIDPKVLKSIRFGNLEAGYDFFNTIMMA